MRGAEISIKERWGPRHHELGSPIPRRGQIARIASEKGACVISTGPRAAPLPQMDSMCLARGEFPDQVTRGRGDMGWSRVAGATLVGRTLGRATLLAAFVCSRARSNY